MKVYFSEHFKKQLKELIKKFRSAKADLLDALEGLDLQNEVSIGHCIYKIRIQNSDAQKGKSGGYRSYIYLYKKSDLLVPLCMYSKSEKENLTTDELKYHFDKTIEELVKIVF